MSAQPNLPDGVVVLERGWLSSNNVVFKCGGHSAVVDTGYATHAAQTVALVRNALGARGLDLIVNTHLHSDHCGGNAELQAAYPSARTLIPPGHAGAVRAWDENALTFQSTGQACDRFGFDGVIGPGTELKLGSATWQVHAAPGHDPHSVVLFEPGSRTLISADALWENGFGIVFPELEGEPAFSEVAKTLDVIDSLHAEVVIPGHGGVFAGRERVDAAIAAARRRLEGLVRDPVRHAAHAMKVLIKFRLLEWQRIEEAKFREWSHATPYIRLVHARFFAGTDFDAWLQGLVAELESSQALARQGGVLVNI